MNDDPLPRRRVPGLGAALVGVVLLLAGGGLAWWLNRPKATTDAPGPGLPDLDVVCLGRIDGLKPVTYLEPSLPGRVAAVQDVEGKHLDPGAEILRLDDESLKLREEEATAAV